MNIVINGKSSAGDFGTVAELLEKEYLNPQVVVVELNGKILPADEYATRKLVEGDSVEIIQFVAGG